MLAFDRIRIETPRLLLRPFRHADAPDLFGVYSDPQVFRHIPRVLVRLGFRHEGTLREHCVVRGETSDSGLYGLLRAEWKGKRA